MVPMSDREHPSLPGSPGVAADDQLDDILTIVEDLRRQLKNCKEMNAKLTEELTTSRKKVTEAEANVSKQAHELDRMSRLLNVCQTENETLISEAVAGQEDQHEAGREIQRLRQELNAAQEASRGLEQQIERLKKVGSELVEQASAREEPLHKRVEELEHELEARASRLDEQGRELRRVGLALSDMAREKEQLEAQVETLERYRAAMSRIHGALRGGPAKG